MTTEQTVALEESSSGKTEKEIEHTLYGKIVDFEQLSSHPNWEDHEQWEIKPPAVEGAAAVGVIRVRKTMTPDGKIEYVQTIKTKANEQASNADRSSTAVPVSEDVFNQFKAMAAKGMVKRRFIFPVEGSDTVYEFDVFPTTDGKWHAWCKIDLEVDNLEEALPELPIKIESLIKAPYGQRSAEEEAKVRELYDTAFSQSREQIEQIRKAHA